LQHDEKWAHRFLNDPWEEVIRDWKAQDVFKADRIRPQRKSTEYDRVALSAALKNWSLARQEDQFLKLKSAPFSVAYCYGFGDEKYSKYAQQLKQDGIPWEFCGFEAGHSLHLSHAKELAEMMKI
jgi:2-succinyl-6-hydroxy-2,4-cyclohexadiene-1-carboxylate synthase